MSMLLTRKARLNLLLTRKARLKLAAEMIPVRDSGYH
jgi:hypothetical protein